MPQAETVAVPRRFPLIIQPENRGLLADKDARLVNAFTEKVGEDHFINKRPGLLQYASLGAANGNGICNWLGDIYAIFGDTVFKNGSPLAGTVDDSAGVYRFSQTKGATPHLQFGNGIATYNYDSGAGIVQIPAGVDNFPQTTVKGIGYLDGTTYVSDENAIIYGDAVLNDTTDWTDLLNRIEAQIEPDMAVAMTKQLVYIILLKQWSSEVFYDAQNATDSPLGPVQGAKINYGCASADGVQDIDSVLYWPSTNRDASPQIITLDNLKASVVSTPAVDRLLNDASFSAGNIASFSLKYNGHKFYVLTLRAENLTLVYDSTEKMFSQWTDPDGDYFPFVDATYLGPTTRILQHESNGKLYLMDYSYFTDAGDTIQVDIYTPNFDGGVRRRKQLNQLTFVADQTAGSYIDVRCNDSDYKANAWTDFRRVDLSVIKPSLPNCGTFQKRAYNLRHARPTPFRISALEMQLDLGTL